MTPGEVPILPLFMPRRLSFFERTGKVAETQRRPCLFAQLVKDEPQLDDSLPAFLKRTYHLKAVDDYETGPDSDIALDRAAAGGRRRYNS